MIVDSKSRLVGDRSDWMLSCSVFQKINQVLGPLEVDLLPPSLPISYHGSSAGDQIYWQKPWMLTNRTEAR